MTTTINQINPSVHIDRSIEDQYVPSWLRRLLMAAIVLSLITVSVSGYIRLVESGLGCSEWPACFGSFHNKESAQGVNVLFEKGKQSPHRIARVMHRLVTTVLGIVILSVFVSSLRQREYGLGKITPCCLMLLTLILAVIGGVHPDQPWPILTLANFLGGLLLVTLSFYLYMRITLPLNYAIQTKYAPLIRVGMLVVVLQILLGGWTSANYAAISCDGLFECENSLHQNVENESSFFSLETLSLDKAGRVIISDRMQTIQYVHHVFAIFSLAYFVCLTLLVKRIEHKLQTASIVVMALMIFQCILGLAALVFQLPLLTILLHNLMSAFLLISVTLLNMKTTSRA